MGFYGVPCVTWVDYALQTYYIFFAAWSDPAPESTKSNWIYSLWVIFTVIFTIVIFNVLIALVTNVYSDLDDNKVAIETREKLVMIVEVCQFRVYFTQWLQAF